MSKVFWDEERMESTIRIFGDILGYDIEVEAHPMDEWSNSGLVDHKNLIDWETVGSKHFYFSTEICNHMDMPDEYILSAIACSVCKRLVFYYMPVIEGRRYNGKILPNAEELDSLIKDMFDQIGISYYDEYEIEDKVRPVRRDVFFSLGNNGCYYVIGDRLRPKHAVEEGEYYTVTDIYSKGDDIMVTCETISDVFTMEEAELFRAFDAVRF